MAAVETNFKETNKKLDERLNALDQGMKNLNCEWMGTGVAFSVWMGKTSDGMLT